jgi:DNA-directed RNA polymerase specialized sigma24 family protein
VSLTGALRAGDPVVFGRLYDEHATGLYSYCRAMVGEEAADALRVAFAAGTRPPGPPSGDSGPRIWLYGLARAECRRRGALLRSSGVAPITSPLGRAVMRLRPEHREALVLSAALQTAELARVLGVAVDSAETLLAVARRRLAQAAARLLSTEHDQEMLLALGDDRLPELLASTSEPPAGLRDQVLVACAVAARTGAGALLFDETGMPIALDTVVGPAESVATESTEPAPPSEPPVTRGRRRVGGVILGLATGAAVAAGAIALWPPTDGGKPFNMDGKSRIEYPRSRTSGPSSATTSPLGGSSRPTGLPPLTAGPHGTPTSSSGPPRSLGPPGSSPSASHSSPQSPTKGPKHPHTHVPSSSTHNPAGH